MRGLSIGLELALREGAIRRLPSQRWTVAGWSFRALTCPPHNNRNSHGEQNGRIR